MIASPDAEPTAEGGTRLHGRPFGIVVLAVLFVLRAVILLIAFAGPSLPEFGPIGRILTMPAETAAAVRDTPALGALLIGIVTLLILSAILLWTGRRAGWLIGILTTGFFLVIDLYQATRGELNTVWTTLDVVVVFYLNQSDVRDHFSANETRPLP